MAHYAILKPTDDPDIFDVVSVNVTYDDDIQTETDTYKQTSYNTFKGKHSNGGAPLRKNFAGIGYVYDRVRDAFYLEQSYPSWTLDEDTAQWVPPIAKPDGDFVWNESTQTWDIPVYTPSGEAP